MPRPKPNVPVDRDAIEALQVIALALVVIAMKMPKPAEVPDEIGEEIVAATAKLRATNANLQQAVDSVPAPKP